MLLRLGMERKFSDMLLRLGMERKFSCVFRMLEDLVASCLIELEPAGGKANQVLQCGCISLTKSERKAANTHQTR